MDNQKLSSMITGGDDTSVDVTANGVWVRVKDHETFITRLALLHMVIESDRQATMKYRHQGVCDVVVTYDASGQYVHCGKPEEDHPLMTASGMTHEYRARTYRTEESVYVTG